MRGSGEGLRKPCLPVAGESCLTDESGLHEIIPGNL